VCVWCVCVVCVCGVCVVCVCMCVCVYVCVFAALGIHNSHAPYCHLWPAPLYNIFPHFRINGTIFEKKVLNTKNVF